MMNLIFALAAATATPVAVPAAFHGTWVANTIACNDAGQNDGITITADAITGSSIVTTPTKIRTLGKNKIIVTGNVSEQGMARGSSGYVMTLRNKGQGLLSVMVQEDGKSVSKPRAIRYKKCS
jgi:hypothetical protein